MASVIDVFLRLVSGGEESHGAHIRAGVFVPADAPTVYIEAIEEAHHDFPTFHAFRRLFVEPERSRPLKPSDDWIEAQTRDPSIPVKHRAYYAAALERRITDEYITKITEYEKQRREREYIITTFPPTHDGYLAFFLAKNPQFLSFFSDKYITLPISEENREKHTYITGGAGSGKTESIKTLILHYLAENKSTAIVLIDPHGDIASEVANWPEAQTDERELVYIAPGMLNDKTPVFNPFDIPDSERNPRDIAKLVDELIELVPEILDGKIEFTNPMETLLKTCFTILFHRKGSDFEDVLKFMDDKTNAPYLVLGHRVLQGSVLLQFLQNNFHSESLRATRASVAMRFISFLGNDLFAGFMFGPSTFHLETLIHKRAIILFNFSKEQCGQNGAKLFGRLILARLKSFAFHQGALSERHRTPVHVFVDECQNFLTPSIETILMEARKFRVYLTMAQQVWGGMADPTMRNIIITNTAVKITGKNSVTTLKAAAAESGMDLEELQTMKTGYFHVQNGGGTKGVIVRFPANRLKNKGAISAAVWKERLAEQIRQFYRKPKPAGFHINVDPTKPEEPTGADGFAYPIN